MAEARPIETAAPGDSPLRWKTKNRGVSTSAEDIPAVPIAGGAPVATTSHTRANWNITRIDPNVRPAQAVSDPFKDPFGDRKQATQTPVAAEPMLLQPTQAERAIEELPAPRAAGPELRGTHAAPMPLVSNTQPPLPGVPGGAVPGVTQPSNNAPGGIVPGVTQPFVPERGGAMQPGGADPTMPSLGAPSTSGAPCNRVFNERNCCDTLANCQLWRERLLSDTIRNISLDITPRFSPDIPAEEELTARTDALRQAEIITWHNKQGAVIATGRMAMLSNNVVSIVDETGREVARILLQDLGTDELCYVTAYWRLPTECALAGTQFAQRQWVPSTFCWTASALCHKPLYFEEVQLERYGHTAGPIRQPIISGAHFFLNLAALPYNMAINPPKECQYALGYYRPGSCAPWMIPPIPLSLRGAAAEAVTVVGGVFLIP